MAVVPDDTPSARISVSFGTLGVVAMEAKEGKTSYEGSFHVQIINAQDWLQQPCSQGGRHYILNDPSNVSLNGRVVEEYLCR